MRHYPLRPLKSPLTHCDILALASFEPEYPGIADGCPSMVHEWCDMSISDVDSPAPVVIDRKSQVPTVVIGIVAEKEFHGARSAISDLARCCDYDDWLDAREGLQIGLGMAGVEARIVPVGLSSFLEWSRLSGTSPDEPALDAFASLASAVRNSPDLRVFAVVRELDFARHFSAIGAFAAHGGYDRWLRHRRATRAEAIAAGLHVEELPIRLDSFLAWCACLGQTESEAALDRYAQLLLEHLTRDPAA
jgi:hypothetical protein